MSDKGQQRLVLFDFDGTLTRKDSLFVFLKYYRGLSFFILNIVRSLPSLVSNKLSIIDNSNAKERLLSNFIKGMSVDEFALRCKEFSVDRVPDILNDPIVKRFHRHISEGDKVIIISASVEDWILPWAQQWNVEVLGTKLASSHGKLTGKFQGKNCNGDEKVKRIKSHFTLNEFNEIWAYGDSPGDEAMFGLADKVIYRGEVRN